MITKFQCTYQFLLLDKLDVSESFGREFDRLIKAIFASVRHINDLYHFCLQPLQHTHDAVNYYQYCYLQAAISL